MQISTIDIIIILVYLFIVALIGSFSGGKQKSTWEYFMGGGNVPWWAVSFSIVAAETSSLTFISIPGLAYITDLSFLQLTIGYVIARILVAIYFLPAYRKGEIATAYTFLETRFGLSTRRFASTVFLFTRVAADGVRLFSTAILVSPSPWPVPVGAGSRCGPWYRASRRPQRSTRQEEVSARKV